jgi:hypothetical protein
MNYDFSGYEDVFTILIKKRRDFWSVLTKEELEEYLFEAISEESGVETVIKEEHIRRYISALSKDELKLLENDVMLY